jgi:hypothetical protein
MSFKLKGTLKDKNGNIFHFTEKDVKALEIVQP